MIKSGDKSVIIMDAIRKANRNAIDKDGSWVIVRGNRFAPRGLRIPRSIRVEGVKHFDIYYAYKEECPWNGAEILPDAADDDDLESLIEELLDNNGILRDQLTWVTLHTPSSQNIRMWAGEISKVSRGLLDEMLAENYIKIMPFTSAIISPVWDEATRDIIGSLMLDGLTEQQAQDELIRAGEKFERKWSLPQYYYQPIGDFREMFSEEPEYDAWWKDQQENLDAEEVQARWLDVSVCPSA